MQAEYIPLNKLSKTFTKPKTMFMYITLENTFSRSETLKNFISKEQKSFTET